MTLAKHTNRIATLETALLESFAELDKADGSRIGLQEAIDASQAIMREAYGVTIDSDVLEYLEEDDLKSFDLENAKSLLVNDRKRTATNFWNTSNCK